MDDTRPTSLQPPVSSLKYLKGKVLSEARNQHGCKFLHQKLQERQPEDIQMIFTDLKGHIGMLMVDEFGSYVIQKLFDVCDEQQMNHMVLSVASDVSLLMSVCLDSRGSESMMKLVECVITLKQLSQLIDAFTEIMVELVTHPIGCNVIAHCYEFFNLPANLAEEILGEIADHFFDIATNDSGSRVMQLVIKDVSNLFAHWRLLAGIRVYLFALCIDQFGNHVVQHVIELGMQSMIGFMVSELRGGFVLLSTHEYGSNVVQKLIEASKETYAPEIINEIIHSPDFLSVLQDPYGSHVVQTAKDYSKLLRITLRELFVRLWIIWLSHTLMASALERMI